VRDDGSLTAAGEELDHLDVFFTCVFTAELVINAYAHWFTDFIANQYNLIDTVVIGLSLVSLGPLDIPVSILRVVRAFRVIRIFGRLSALKNIIASLTASLIPVFNAFLLVILCMSICAPPPLLPSSPPSLSCLY
jgi:voltage-dependent calcium channel L type alpha-1D